MITRTITYRVLLLSTVLLSTFEIGKAAGKAAEKAAGTGVGRYGGDTATNTLLTSAPQDHKYSCLFCACLK